MDEIYGKRTIKVYCKKCKVWIDEELVEALNIEEDFQGRDVLTFKCPECRTEQSSLRVG